MILFKIYLSVLILSIAYMVMMFFAITGAKTTHQRDKYEAVWAAMVIAIGVQIITGLLGAIWFLL